MIVLTNKEIAERFNAMQGDDISKINVLARMTEIPKKTLREIIESENGKPVEEPDPIIESAAVLNFEPGTAIYKLVEERLDTLDRIIKNCTEEYKELARYIKDGH